MKGSEIFLSDLIEVTHFLGVNTNEVSIARVGAVLGFAAAPRAPMVEPVSPPPPPRTPPTHEKPKLETLRKPTKTPQPLTLTRRETVVGTPPAWLDQATSFPIETDVDLDFAPPYEPLFATRQARGIVSAALATRLPAGEIDEEKLVAARARREPVVTLPRRPIASLQRGVQVLLDRRDAMMPFFGDQNQLVDVLRTVVGRERVAVLQFTHHPLKVLSPDRRRSVAYCPPVAGTPILIVTNFGIGGPPLVADGLFERDWHSLADVARQAGCPIIAFVPYPPDRWPASLARAITILQWDRPTTAGVVRRRVGPGLVAPS